MEFRDVILQRRAVNFFDTTKDAADEQIKQLIEAASLAPSSYNLQPWNAIIVREKERNEALRKVAMNQPKVIEAPVLLIILADTEGWKKGN